MSGQGIGMMDPAYFVGRKAILSWINEAFELSLSKIEETASGAVACQILDALYPGELPASKIRWDAKSSHEMLENYKLIQSLFTKKGITKNVEVEKLTRGRYQDNLELCQWLKSFFEKNYTGNSYDPVTRRQKGRGADTTVSFSTVGKNAGPRILPINGSATDDMPTNTAAPVSHAPKAAAVASPTGNMRGASTVGASASNNHMSSSTGPAATKRINELSTQVADLRLTVESLEKERDFYFGKLRDIEILLQSYNGTDKGTVDTIFKILYATDENAEFVAQDGDVSM